MKILQLSKLPDYYTRYDLEISYTHNFIAEDVVVHNTSSNIHIEDGKVTLFSGGSKHETFARLFDQEKLLSIFNEHGYTNLTIYGEAYGGSILRMSETYGKEIKFVAFEVKIGDHWLSVPAAENIVKEFELDFVHYVEIPAELEDIDEQRDLPSVQAEKNGMGAKDREGVVLRPLIEVTLNNGGRFISKHKGEKFLERTKQPKVDDPEKLRIIEDSKKIAEDWVTTMRLEHIIDKLRPSVDNFGFEEIKLVINAMVTNVMKEGEGEILDTKDARRAIGNKAVALYKKWLEEEGNQE